MPKQILNGIDYANGIDQAKLAKIGDAALTTVAQDLSGAVNELKSNLNELATVDKASSPTVVAVDGTYQIPNNVLAHKIIIIGVRRQGNGGSMCFEKSNLLAMDSHFAIMATHSGSGYTLKCSTTGVLTLVGKDSGLLEPFIEVVGLF